MSKRLGGIIGFKEKISSWHLNGFPDGTNIGLTVPFGGEWCFGFSCQFESVPHKAGMGVCRFVAQGKVCLDRLRPREISVFKALFNNTCWSFWRIREALRNTQGEGPDQKSEAGSDLRSPDRQQKR